MRIPGGDVLTVAHQSLAEALAAEWQAAGGAMNGAVKAEDTPLTRLAGTAHVRIAPDPGPTIAAIAAYGETDLLCYRVGNPVALAERQAREWQPWLDWAALALDAPLRSTTGVAHLAQDAAALAALRRAVAACSPLLLSALGVAVPALGSLVLGLALASGALEAEAACDLATLDERFQAEIWGDDAEAINRRAAVRADVAAAARLMALVRA
jgi:chaperone required for assembly of F1-ATPase